MTSALWRHPAWLAVLLGAPATAAGVEPADPAAPVAQPDLSSLATSPEIAAGGEAALGNVPEDRSSVEVDAETIPAEEDEMRLESTSIRALYRRGPVHVPK